MYKQLVHLPWREGRNHATNTAGGHNHPANPTRKVGIPTPTPTPIAILSLALKPEALVLIGFADGLLLLSVSTGVGEGPTAVDAETFEVTKSLGTLLDATPAILVAVAVDVLVG